MSDSLFCPFVSRLTSHVSRLTNFCPSYHLALLPYAGGTPVRAERSLPT